MRLNSFYSSRLFHVILLLLLGNLTATRGQQTGGGGNGGGNAGGGGTGTPAAGGGGGGGGGASTLQSEAKVLVYQSITECIGDLIDKMQHTTISDKAKKNRDKKPAFITTLPFLPDDAASCWEFKRQLRYWDEQLIALQAKQTPYEDTIDNYNSILDDLRTTKDYYGFLAPGAGAAAASSTSTTYPPDIKELEGVGSSFSSFGVIASTISGALTIAQTFHSTFTTSTGALGLDQPTVNSLVTNELLNRGYGVCDFTQLIVSEHDYDDSMDDADPTKWPPLGDQRILQLMQTFTYNLNKLDQSLIPLPMPLAAYTPPLAGTPAAANPPPVTEDFATDFSHEAVRLAEYLAADDADDDHCPLHHKNPDGTRTTHLTPSDRENLRSDLQAVMVNTDQYFYAYEELRPDQNKTTPLPTPPKPGTALQPDDRGSLLKTKWADVYADYQKAYTLRKSGLPAVLTAASNFEQVILGVASPKYPLSSSSSANGGQTALHVTDPSGGNTNATPSGNSLNIALPGGGSVMATFATNAPSAAPQGNNAQAATTVQTSPINYVEKFAMIERYLHIMQDRDIKLIAAHVIVGDSTETHVSRALLTDFVALSNRAVVEIQVFDPLLGEYVYSDHSESDHQYTYFPGRVRDGAENKWESHDMLDHPRDVPYNDLEWMTRFDRAQAIAKQEKRPILVQFLNSDDQTLTKKTDDRLFATNDFKEFAADNLVLVRIDERINSNPTVTYLTKLNRSVPQKPAPPAVQPPSGFELLNSEGTSVLATSTDLSSSDPDDFLDAVKHFCSKTK